VIAASAFSLQYLTYPVFVEEAQRELASVLRAIQPFHSMSDGDVLSAVATGEVDNKNLNLLKACPLNRPARAIPRLFRQTCLRSSRNRRRPGGWRRIRRSRLRRLETRISLLPTEEINLVLLNYLLRLATSPIVDTIAAYSEKDQTGDRS